MESKPVKQAIAMALDTIGMEGPVTRRAIAEEVMRLNPPWSVSDEYDAKLASYQREAKVQMNAPHSRVFIKRELSHIPEEIRDTIRNLPFFICTSPGGGRDAVHIRTLLATKEDWEANFALKDRIMQATRFSRDGSRDIRDLLETTGAGCLADLMNGRVSA